MHYSEKVRLHMERGALFIKKVVEEDREIRKYYQISKHTKELCHCISAVPKSEGTEVCVGHLRGNPQAFRGVIESRDSWFEIQINNFRTVDDQEWKKLPTQKKIAMQVKMHTLRIPRTVGHGTVCYLDGEEYTISNKYSDPIMHSCIVLPELVEKYYPKATFESPVVEVSVPTAVKRRSVGKSLKVLRIDLEACEEFTDTQRRHIRSLGKILSNFGYHTHTFWSHSSGNVQDGFILHCLGDHNSMLMDVGEELIPRGMGTGYKDGEFDGEATFELLVTLIRKEDPTEIHQLYHVH